MPSPPSQSFSFVYNVTVVGGVLQTDGINQIGNGQSDVVSDNIPDGSSDDPAILGDVFNDQIAGEVSGNPTPSATYLGLAFNAANGSSGILVRGNNSHTLYYLTNTAVTDVSGSNG